MTTQFTTLFFVLFTILFSNCLKISNTSNQITLAQTSSSMTPVQLDNIAVLGKAVYFTVLAGSTTTNAGVTNVEGSVGVSPGTAIAGTAIILTNGAFHAGDPVGLEAQKDLTTAYNNLANAAGGLDMTGKYLDGLTLFPGIYKYTSSCFLNSGILTLDGKGDANSKWIFQIGSTLITGLNTQVKMINNGSALNVYWTVGSSATISDHTIMVGNLISYASIAFGNFVTLNGRALARTGEITMLSNTIGVK